MFSGGSREDGSKKDSVRNAEETGEFVLLPYNPIKALTVPRPIGWISTISKDGVGNLAPFSYFNGLSYNPPFVMFSGGSVKAAIMVSYVLARQLGGDAPLMAATLTAETIIAAFTLPPILAWAIRVGAT